MRHPHHPPTSMTITMPLKTSSIDALLLLQSMDALVHGPDYYPSSPSSSSFSPPPPTLQATAGPACVPSVRLFPRS